MPNSATPHRDPRSIITPDAFEVSSDLLGMPLASPRRRLAALLVDLLVIGVITMVTSSFALVLGAVAAVLFVREGFKRTPVRGSVFGRAMRLSVGCLGVWIGIITMVAWMAFGIGGGFGGGNDGDPDDEGDRVSQALGRATETLGVGGLLGLAEGIELAERLSEAEGRDEALTIATELARVGREAGLDSEQLRDILVEAMPDHAEWSDDTEVLVDLALSTSSGDSTAVADADEPEGEVPNVLADPVVADTLRRLGTELTRLQAMADARQETAEELRQALREEREGGSVFSVLRDFIDELGFGFGWASLYLTVMLTWWKGQTVGKRLMGIRVVRLDGEPITWWVAFERAGGYAAGFATGLLGFAQVYWDANRQAIHDRIVGTVVVTEGAERVLDWEKAI